MKKIQLKRGAIALVSDEDYEILKNYQWLLKRRRNYTSYAYRYYQKNDGKQSEIFMHRQILSITNPKTFVDHKDGDGLNNQRDNLRIATPSQNMANRRAVKNKASKYLGVTWHKPNKKWRAKITNNHVYRHIGLFTDEKEAALAYNKRAMELHGEFARLNVV